MLSRAPFFTAPVFGDRIDLALPERIQMAYFDDSGGFSSAFSKPQGTGSPLNGCWQEGELSNSFQPLAADSIIKIIKKGGKEWAGGEERRGKKCNSSVAGMHAWTLFQLACLLWRSKDTLSWKFYCWPKTGRYAGGNTARAAHKLPGSWWAVSC